jgi:hypothetical protein
LDERHCHPTDGCAPASRGAQPSDMHGVQTY